MYIPDEVLEIASVLAKRHEVLTKHGYEIVGFGAPPNYERYYVHPDYRDALLTIRKQVTDEFITKLPVGVVIPF